MNLEFSVLIDFLSQKLKNQIFPSKRQLRIKVKYLFYFNKCQKYRYFTYLYYCILNERQQYLKINREKLVKFSIVNMEKLTFLTYNLNRKISENSDINILNY